MRTSSKALLVILAFASGCGPSGQEADDVTSARARRRAPGSVKPGSAPALRATELGRVPSVTYGPYLGQGPRGGLVVWAALEGATRSFTVVPLSTEGRPSAAARAVHAAPESLGLVAVRPSASGFVIVYTRPTAEGESLSALCTNEKGDPVGAPSPLVSLSGRALWVDAAPSARGALVFYASRPDPGKRAGEIGALPLDAKCAAGTRAVIADDALAWQIASNGARTFLAMVRSAQGPGGNVDVVPVEADGKPGQAIAVSHDAAADLDLDAARVGESVVLAWTDRRPLEPRVVTAAIDASGKLASGPQPLTSPQGEQSLLRLVPASKGTAFVAWENLSERPGSGRIVQLSAIDAAGKLSGPRARLHYGSEDGGVPELAASPRGLAALTLAPVCPRGASCDEADIAPIFLELDQQLSPIAAEPLRLEPLKGALAELGFALGCSARSCFAIAAMARTPAPIFATELEARSSTYQAPVERVSESVTPRVAAHESLSNVESCSAIAVESAGGQEYLATITDFDATTPWRRLDKPAPDGRFEPLRARIALERLGAGLRPAEGVKASPLSLRAHSFGGVALAAGEPARGELLAAWAGVDQGMPQIFLTLVGKTGERISQRMLTRKKGDLGDIALAWVGDGWIVAWVDERFGDLEVFAIKLDSRLNRMGPEQRITEAPGAASEPALAFDGTNLRLVWSDARSAEVPGHADIFTVLLRARDAARVGNELRVAETRAHSFSPSVQSRSGAFFVAWAERGEQGGDPGSLRLASVRADGSVGSTTSLSVAGAEPRSATLSCTDRACRLAAIVERDHAASLAVASWTGEATPSELAPVLRLLGSTGTSVSPVIHQDGVLFCDATSTGARIRRAQIVW